MVKDLLPGALNRHNTTLTRRLRFPLRKECWTRDGPNSISPLLRDKSGAMSVFARPQRAQGLYRAQRATFRPTERGTRSEEHTSELQSLMRISYAVFCLKKKTNIKKH